jgi:hypothetical protein
MAGQHLWRQAATMSQIALAPGAVSMIERTSGS